MKLLFLVPCAVLMTGCGLVLGTQVQGSGKASTANYTVGKGQKLEPFTKIETSGSFDVEIQQGPQSDVVVSGDDNILPLVKLESKDGVLYVSITKGYSTHNDLVLKVTLPKVEGMTINGSGSAHLEGIHGDSVALAIEGSGDIYAKGDAESVAASIDGSGSIHADTLKVKSATTSISGSGSIDVDSSNTLAAEISGSGDINYKGDPKVTKAIDGSGGVNKL